MIPLRSLRTLLYGIVLCGAIASISACRKAEPWDESEFDERLSGGAQTVFTEGVGAFSQAFPTLSGWREAFHELGDLHFEATFVAAPAPLFQGLGTIYNSNSCFNCHVNDGRGKPIQASEPMTSMLFRTSVPGTDPHGGPLGAPGFGGQLQDKAIFGVAAEAGVQVLWEETPFTFADGDTVLLRRPVWSVVTPYAALPAGWMMSPRVAPPVHGMGLLEQIAAQDLLAQEDAADRDGDGISGRANRVWDAVRKQETVGRFGWKAEAPTLEQQVAGAYNEDMGITNRVFPIESSHGQPQFDGRSDEPEVADSVFDAVVFYVKTLAVPARRNVTDPIVRRGKDIFRAANCEGCHRSSFTTRTDMAFPEASGQKIHPYTDLLLHDLGPALSDDRPAFAAGGSEWRTPPLWGIGLTQVVNGHNNFLHDGRARSLLEAILWHGGEAARSVDYVRNLNRADREALVAFLKSL
jgi:CxxC motif-containing protein (DUF1111 family)